MTDQLASGQRFGILNVVDDGTRACVLSEAATSIPGSVVARLLGEAVKERGKPKVLLSDNGPEFTGKALDSSTASSRNASSRGNRCTTLTSSVSTVGCATSSSTRMGS